MRLYILNITKSYSEDEDGYAGEWFNCPVDFEEVKEKLGVKEVEEIEIADYELPFAPVSYTHLAGAASRIFPYSCLSASRRKVCR